MFRLIAALAIFFLPNLACADEIRIGVIQSLSGIAQIDGHTVVNSLTLAANELNSQSNTKIKLVVEDDSSRAANALSAYQKLKTQGVDAIIGGTWSFLARAIIPAVVRDRTVLVTTSNFPEMFDLAEGQGYFFTTALPAAEHIKALEKFLRDSPVRSAALLAVNTPWGTTQAKLYHAALQKLGIKVLLNEISDRVETNDWRDIVPRLQKLQPELVVLATGNNDVDSFLKRAREIKLQSKLFGSTHTLKAFNLSSVRRYYEGVCFPFPLEQLDREENFRRAYQSKYGEQPELYSDCSYDALLVLHQAVSRARAERAPVETILRRDSFEGIVGTYRYDESRSLGTGKASLVCIENGKAVIPALP